MLSLQTIAPAAFVALGLVYLLNRLSYRRRMKGAKNIPEPRGFSLVGNVLDLDSPNLIPVFNKWDKEYGPIVAFEIFGPQQVALSTDKSD
ncbi:putative Cytochrome P450 [Seiridium cardinale]